MSGGSEVEGPRGSSYASIMPRERVSYHLFLGQTSFIPQARVLARSVHKTKRRGWCAKPKRCVNVSIHIEQIAR